MARRSDPQWRDIAARGLVLDRIPGVRVARALLLLERAGEVRSALEASGAQVAHWDRRLGGSAELVSGWPPSGSFDWIGLRLLQAAEELRMMAGVAAARLSPGGALWVYGANDEGITSAPKRLAGTFGAFKTIAVGGRCRVIEARDPDPGALGALGDWEVLGIGDDPLHEEWLGYPGCFAHGRVDGGTALLLEHLPPLDSKAQVLDFGCGTGVIAAAVRTETPDAELSMLDNDALALEAASRNVPGATIILSQGLAGAPRAAFDWIVSNPPYHVGKKGTAAVLSELCRSAPEYLRPGGGLRCVVQSTHALGELLTRHFRATDVIAETASFRVWEALQ